MSLLASISDKAAKNKASQPQNEDTYKEGKSDEKLTSKKPHEDVNLNQTTTDVKPQSTGTVRRVNTNNF